MSKISKSKKEIMQAFDKMIGMFVASKQEEKEDSCDKSKERCPVEIFINDILENINDGIFELQESGHIEINETPKILANIMVNFINHISEEKHGIGSFSLICMSTLKEFSNISAKTIYLSMK